LLREEQLAFAFDGRLGQYPAKVRITLREGADPVSLPLYGASPAKREVIDKQIDAWWSQGVVEESNSPWAFPVVIVYRNGKPRL
ncbi:hypothetical protein CALCODRAFT_408934, partial [Calocera cornea HHB12733]